MRIEAERLTPAGERFTQTYGPGELSLEDERVRLAGDVAVEGRASRKGEEVRLTGRIRATAEIPCDRCLTPVSVPLEVEFDTGFVPAQAEAARAENVELLAEEMGLSAFDGEAVDLDELVREQVLLAVPTRLVCREDCRGLCPECGTDLNEGNCACARDETDPRWDALAGWSKDRES